MRCGILKWSRSMRRTSNVPPSARPLRSAHLLSRVALLLSAGVAFTSWSSASASLTEPDATRGLDVPVVRTRGITGTTGGLVAPRLGQLTLRNAGAVDVRIEVRLADARSCDAVPAGSVRVLPAGKSWLIASHRPICWRRASDLALPVSTWSAWERRELGTDERAEVQL
jgi:hypothetical protein